MWQYRRSSRYWAILAWSVLSCHNAIWEQAAALIKADTNPDKLSHEALAAELTNHLVAGVVLIPGASATMPELQQVGFHYAK